MAGDPVPGEPLADHEGNGTGQFTESATYLTGTSQNHFVITDLNVDGRPDIVGTVRGGYYLLFNTCAGDQGASADLDSTVIGPETGAVGDQLTYTAFVANNGPDPATNVVATFVVPAGMNFISSSNDCSVSYGTLQCQLPTIAPDANESFTVTVQAFAARHARESVDGDRNGGRSRLESTTSAAQIPSSHREPSRSS